MRAGRLRTKAEIQRRTASGTFDAANRPVWTWATIKTLWGDLIPLSGSELSQAQTIVANASYKLLIRLRNFLPTPEDRVYLSRSGKTLEIGSVQGDQFGESMTLICGEVLA